MSRDLTGRCRSARQQAAIRGVSPSKVIAWIRAGKLPAANMAAGMLGRPRFRIAPEDAAAFWEGRLVKSAVPATKRRRRTLAQALEYFKAAEVTT